MRLLKCDSSKISVRAAYVLGFWSRIFRELPEDNSIELIDTILELLQDQDLTVRHKAAYALSLMPSSYPIVVQVLLSLLEIDSDSRIRNVAAATIGRSDDTSFAVINQLLKSLKDEDEKVRSSAAISLGRLKEKSNTVINSLFDLLADENPNPRCAAAKVLLDMVCDSVEVITKLMSTSENSIYESPMIGDLLESLNGKGIDVKPQLLQWIEAQPHDVPIGAAMAYGRSETIDGLRSMIE